MAYIEPCCCDRQLPQLLRQQRGATLFQTNGDVTAKHLLKAVCCMVEYGNELWLAADTIDLPLLRLLRHWHDRNWIDHLWLITRENQADTVTAELSATYGEHLHYACRDTLCRYRPQKAHGAIRQRFDKSLVVVGVLANHLPDDS